MTASLAIGSVPAVLAGSLLSSSAPDRYVRPAITFVIAASGLKYVGVGTTALGWILCGLLLAAGSLWLGVARPWQRGPRLTAVISGPEQVDGLAVDEADALRVEERIWRTG